MNRLIVEGEGGHKFEVDVDLMSVYQREHMAGQIERGQLVIVERLDQAGDSLEPSTPGDTRPTARASKADWLDYAVNGCGADPDETALLSRDALVEKFGSDEPTI